MVRVATWNVNGVNDRIDLITLWLEDRQPDIVALQEIKTTEQNFPFEEFQELGYRVGIHGEPGKYGVAIAASTYFEVTQLGLSGREQDGTRLIVADFESFKFASVYCPSAPRRDAVRFRKKIEWFKSLRDFCNMEISDGHDFLIGGDFNICQSWLDSYTYKYWGNRAFEEEWDLHSREERKALDDLKHLRLTDLYRYKYPESAKFTYWFDRNTGNFDSDDGSRIDLLFGTNAIVERLIDVTIDREYRKRRKGLYPSDHAPVYVDLNYQGNERKRTAPKSVVSSKDYRRRTRTKDH